MRGYATQTLYLVKATVLTDYYSLDSERNIMNRHARPQRLGALMIAVVIMLASGHNMGAQTMAEPHGRTIHPHALAFNPTTHRLYCVDEDTDRVLVIGPAGQRSSITVGNQPNAIAIDPALHRIYVVNAGSGNVSVVDGTSDRVIATVATDKRPYAIGIDTALHRTYVTNTFSDKVTVVDGTTDSAQQMPLGSKDFVETDARRGRAFFISYEDPALTLLDAAGKIHREDLGLSHPWGLAIDEQRGIVYITEIGKDTLIAYHENDGKIEKVLTGSMPDAVAVDEAANKVYIANYAADSVTVIDGATMKPIATVAVGHHPQALAVDGKRHLVFVANTHSNDATVINGSTNRALATIPAGTNPYAVAVDPESGGAYVANYGAQAVTKLDLSSIH
jgi:YVTN family beta-propeller protein